MTTHLFFLVTLLSVSLVVIGCGKKGASLAPGEQAQALVGDAIINQVDWINMSAVSTQHPVYKISRAVGVVTVPSQESRCTAFLVTKDIIMTNWHCFPTAEDAEGAELYLDFLKGSGKEGYRSTASYQCDHLIMSNQKLDVALLACQGSPGTSHGTVTLEAKTSNNKMMSDNANIYVIHQNCDYYANPECAPTKKVSLGKFMSAYVPPTGMPTTGMPNTSTDLFYNADTLGGSSGSPVFSYTTHRVVALHHLGLGQTMWSSGRGERNSGVSMPLIVNFIRSNFPQIPLVTN